MGKIKIEFIEDRGDIKKGTICEAKEKDAKLYIKEGSARAVEPLVQEYRKDCT